VNPSGSVRMASLLWTIEFILDRNITTRNFTIKNFPFSETRIESSFRVVSMKLQLRIRKVLGSYSALRSVKFLKGFHIF
jgi:hypothetical protein